MCLIEIVHKKPYLCTYLSWQWDKNIGNLGYLLRFNFFQKFRIFWKFWYFETFEFLITQKSLVRNCCKWSQKLLLGPFSSLVKSNLRVFKWGHDKVNISSLKQHFTLKFALFGAITQKPLVRKCCEWSQKLLLGPLSTLVKSNLRVFKWGYDKVNISSLKQHFTLKMGGL